MIAEEVPRALSSALEAGQIEVTHHFWDELRGDLSALVDVRSAIETIVSIRDAGTDRGGHPKFEAVIPADDPSEPCSEPQTVEFLREVHARAEAGDIEWLKRIGDVYARVPA